jgi:hypothetical protein
MRTSLLKRFLKADAVAAEVLFLREARTAASIARLGGPFHRTRRVQFVIASKDELCRLNQSVGA